MSSAQEFFLAWLGLTSVLAFAVFGYDKYRAKQSGRRVPEFHLVCLAALGGWLGGAAGMWLFRHKTAKPSFKLKYAGAFLVWAGLIYAFWTV